MTTNLPPYGAPPPTPTEPPKRNRTLLIVGIVLAVCLLLTLCMSLLGVGAFVMTREGGLSGLLNPSQPTQSERPAPQATQRPAQGQPSQPQAQPTQRPGQAPQAQPTQRPATPGGGATKASPDTLRLPGGDPPTLDPALAQDSTSANYIVEIFSGLVTISRDLKIQPDLAKDWTVKDGKVYTFNLRDDVTFHDGK